jgi:glutamate synthase (NADPH/NADH) small chain
MQKGGRSNPGGFLIEQRRLEKQPADLRVRAFTEITLKPTAAGGTAQASRCTDWNRSISSPLTTTATASIH